MASDTAALVIQMDSDWSKAEAAFDKAYQGFSQKAGSIASLFNGLDFAGLIDKIGSLDTKLSNVGGNNNAEINMQQLAKATAEAELAQLRLNNAQNKGATITQGDSYKQLSQTYRELARDAQDYAAKQVLAGNANFATDQTFVSLKDKAKQASDQLNTIDQSVGKYGRNVGNYASHWNGLGNAINQLTREAPAFANSLQTGFMAISNNIPILSDEIGKLRTQNKALAAEGKPTTSVLSQLGSSLFSWNTALSVGVTLLTIYGSKIPELTKELLGHGKAIDYLKIKREEDLRIQQQATNTVGDEVAKTALLVATIKSEVTSWDQKKQAIDSLMSISPQYFGNLDKEHISISQLNSDYSKYIESIVKAANAQVNAIQIQNKSKDLVKVMTELNGLSNDIAINNAKDLTLADVRGKSYGKITDEIKKQADQQNKYGAIGEAAQYSANKKVNDEIQRKNDLLQRQYKLTAEISSLSNQAVKDNPNISINGGKTKKPKETHEQKRLEDIKKAYEDFYKEMDFIQRKNERKGFAPGEMDKSINNTYSALLDSLDKLKAPKDGLYNKLLGQFDFRKAQEQFEKNWADLHKASESISKSFNSTFKDAPKVGIQMLNEYSEKYLDLTHMMSSQEGIPFDDILGKSEPQLKVVQKRYREISDMLVEIARLQGKNTDEIEDEINLKNKLKKSNIQITDGQEDNLKNTKNIVKETLESKRLTEAWKEQVTQLGGQLAGDLVGNLLQGKNVLQSWGSILTGLISKFAAMAAQAAILSALGGITGAGGTKITSFGDIFGSLLGFATGGTVNAGGLYRVNEFGSELFSVGDKQYLMAGQNGTITPMNNMSVDTSRVGRSAQPQVVRVVVEGELSGRSIKLAGDNYSNFKGR